MIASEAMAGADTVTIMDQYGAKFQLTDLRRIGL